MSAGQVPRVSETINKFKNEFPTLTIEFVNWYMCDVIW